MGGRASCNIIRRSLQAFDVADAPSSSGLFQHRCDNNPYQTTQRITSAIRPLIEQYQLL